MGTIVPSHCRGGRRRLRGRLALAILALLAACSGEAREAPRAQSESPLPQPARPTDEAPPTFRAVFETSAGSFTIEVHRDWAPLGADRFYELARSGFYDDTRVYRVLPGFMAQLGINGDPAVSARWEGSAIRDDPVRESNTRGRVTFATQGPDTRTTELFINYGDNARLDPLGFAPFGEVVEGMEVVEGFYADYGETAPAGPGPSWDRAMVEGNAYLDADFPLLTRIVEVTVEP